MQMLDDLKRLPQKHMSETPLRSRASENVFGFPGPSSELTKDDNTSTSGSIDHQQRGTLPANVRVGRFPSSDGMSTAPSLRADPFSESATIRSEVRSPGRLTEPMEPLPQQMPRLARASAYEDVGAIPDGNVLDAIWNRKPAGKLAGLEHRLEVGV